MMRSKQLFPNIFYLELNPLTSLMFNELLRMSPSNVISENKKIMYQFLGHLSHSKIVNFMDSASRGPEGCDQNLQN